VEASSSRNVFLRRCFTTTMGELRFSSRGFRAARCRRCIAISYGAVVEETCGYDEEYHFGVWPINVCCVVLCCVVLWIRIIWNTLYG
jgi:hypothetical protein